MKIEFGFLSYKLLLVLLYPIFYKIRDFDLNKESSPPPVLYGYFTSSISYLLAGPFYLLVLFRSRDHKKISIEKYSVSSYTIKNQLYLVNQNINKRRRIKKLIEIFLLTLIYMMPMLIEGYALKNHKLYFKFNESFGVFSAILFYMLFSNLFLSTKIYRHQLISLLAVFFCSIIFLLINIRIYISNDFSDVIGTLFCSLVIYGFFALYDVLVKRHFDIHLNNPYYYMFFVGIFSIILIIPLDLLVYFYNKSDVILGLEIINQVQIFYNSNKLFLLIFFFDIICKFIGFLGIILTLYYFTPCHIIISLTFLQFLSECIIWVKNPKGADPWNIILLYVLLYSIINFSSLIYNEIIIICLWSMEENTFKYISFRQRLEIENAQNNDEENLIRQNTTSTNSSFDDDN